MRLGAHASLWVLCLALTAGSAAAASAATPVIVAPARVMAFEDRIEALGTLKANESVVLTASVTETVTGLNFDDGDRVVEGAILAEMTSAEEQALLREAEALAAEASASTAASSPWPSRARPLSRCWTSASARGRRLAHAWLPSSRACPTGSSAPRSPASSGCATSASGRWSNPAT